MYLFKFRYHLPRLVFILFLLFWIMIFSPPAEAQNGSRPLSPVDIIVVEPTDVEVLRDYPARVHGARQVQVRARVGGILQERLYVEGQVVAQNDLLFRIDAEPFEIALRRAEAERANARANLNHAEREWARYSALFDQAAVSAREHDRALTELELAQARLALTETAVAEAKLNLQYTQVRAPVSGVTGMETISEGNLIEWGGLLATITQQDPVHLRFALPEQDAAAQVSRRRTMPKDSNTSECCSALLLLANGSAYAHTGTIDFTASTIDTRTGAVMVRAVFPNPDNLLLPGQFVRVRIPLQNFTDVFMIPEEAVSQGRDSTQVFVIDANETAQARPVRLGPVVDGKQVILEGLSSGERVVTNGHVMLQHGMPVAIRGTR